MQDFCDKSGIRQQEGCWTPEQHLLQEMNQVTEEDLSVKIIQRAPVCFSITSYPDFAEYSLRSEHAVFCGVTP